MFCFPWIRPSSLCCLCCGLEGVVTRSCTLLKCFSFRKTTALHQGQTTQTTFRLRQSRFAGTAARGETSEGAREREKGRQRHSHPPKNLAPITVHHVPWP
ncbi:hypothetical protein NQD34_010626 [Periophthalmus magnuspinnatus]|nr:hypothetical protein NQD34_010626 [Periophthalmus magnuspinnatus]